jgi:hypothetical protein
MFPMHNAVYGRPPNTPVVQCHGIWPILNDDPVDDVFDVNTGLCIDRERAIQEMLIPLDAPKLSSINPNWREVASDIYEGPLHMLGDPYNLVTADHLSQLRARLGCRFEIGSVGYHGGGECGIDMRLYKGYAPEFDLNDNGEVDEQDEQLVAARVGGKVRQNLYFMAYFGGDWLTSGASLDPEHPPGIPVIADYCYGAGYDADAGVIRLFDSPGPNQDVWVEYHHDAPAAAGEDNIRVHLYREIE